MVNEGLISDRGKRKKRPTNSVAGIALAMDFSENDRFGRNNLDLVQHGLLLGGILRW
jgi:hypothetical protein